MANKKKDKTIIWKKSKIVEHDLKWKINVNSMTDQYK